MSRADGTRRLVGLGLLVAAALLHARVAAAQAGAPVTAVRAGRTVVLDGILDEDDWQSAPRFDDFVQQVPDAGAGATDRTEVRVVFDDEALYVGVRAFQSPNIPVVADELLRDAGRIHTRNDSFTVALDTFADRRNGYVFIFTPLGAIADWACTDEGRVWSQDWDTVWDVRTSIEPWGWSAEMRLPFRSLRFPGPGPQRWGVTFRRIVLARNEWSYSTFIPPDWGTSGIGKFSSANELQGLVIGASSHNLEVTPYALGGVLDQRRAASAATGETAESEATAVTEALRDAGVDLKYGLTSNLTGDVTFNTDFAQVEADRQQVNFTRFSLFFPEKRQFFLEGKGIFDFGNTRGDFLLLPFFSRRIGIEDGQSVPVLGGGRLTGKAGAYTLGALVVRTREENGIPATTFTALRLKRDILGRSNIGLIATDRRDEDGERNHAYGADAYFAFGTNDVIEGFATRAWSPEAEDGTWAYKLRAIHNGDLFTAEAERLVIGENYEPGSGFVRRRDAERWFTRLQLSPRPDSGPVRQVFVGGSFDHVTDTAGRLDSRDIDGSLRLELHSADVFQVAVARRFDAPVLPFRVAGRLLVPAGPYRFTELVATWTASPTRPVSGLLRYRDGGYYGGTRRALSANLVLKANENLQLDADYAVNHLKLPSGDHVSHLVGAGISYSASTRLFMSGLVQWNNSASELDVNLRLSWMYRPLSYLYVVYTDNRIPLDRTDGRRIRSLVVKMTRLMRF